MKAQIALKKLREELGDAVKELETLAQVQAAVGGHQAADQTLLAIRRKRRLLEKVQDGQVTL